MPHARTSTLTAALGVTALLLVPAVPQAHAELAGTTTHVVQPGETLGQISTNLGVGLNTLISLNKLDNPDVLSVGQTLSVPGGSSAASAASPPVQQAARAANASGGTYTVAAGDTLWAIAHQFGTTIPALVEANALDNPDSLKVGRQLNLPGGEANRAPAAPVSASSYTVQPGDSLFKIGRQFGVSITALADANGLDDPDRLSTGTILKLPGGGPSPAPAQPQPQAQSQAPGQSQPQGQTRQHVVRVGETLKDIAAEEKVDLGVLIDVNNMDNPELLQVGQVLVVPPSPPERPADGSSAAASDSKPGAAGSKPGTLVAASVPPSPPPKPNPVSTAAPAPAAPAPAARPTSGPQPAPKPAPAPPAPNGPAPKPGEGLDSYAQRFLGARYVFGGSSPAGFDCSGFVWYVARQLNKPIPRGMQGEYNSGPHPKKEELKPGDMVFFQNTYKPGLSHNGFYLGNGKFIHAADERSGVTVSDMNAPFWSSHWFGATRLA